MKFKNGFILALVVVALAAYWLGRARTVAAAGSSSRVFEIRTYTAEPDKLQALHARFRNHSDRIFKKHGMTSVGYFAPMDSPLSSNTMIYILAFPSREAADKSWEEFRNDPEWQKVRAESEVNGRLAIKVDSVFANSTDYSPLK